MSLPAQGLITSRRNKEMSKKIQRSLLANAQTGQIWHMSWPFRFKACSEHKRKKFIDDIEYCPDAEDPVLEFFERSEAGQSDLSIAHDWKGRGLRRPVFGNGEPRRFTASNLSALSRDTRLAGKWPYGTSNSVLNRISGQWKSHR